MLASAVAALGHLKTEKAAEPLLKHLEVDFDPALEALKELGTLAEPAALARLKDKNADRKVRLDACKVLIFVFTVKSGPELTALSRDKRDSELAPIARAALAHDRAVATAEANMNRTDALGFRERAEGLKSLANLAPNGRRAEVAASLIRQLAKDNPWTREELGTALAVWHVPETVPSLIQVLRNRASDPFQHHTIPILTALGRLKDPRAVDEIVPLLGNNFVHENVRQALVNLGDVAEWPLHKHLEDSNPKIRAAVCDVLRSVGTEDSIPALQAAALDSDGQVAAKANEALAAIARRGP
jgi:HEAT repeat protein